MNLLRKLFGGGSSDGPSGGRDAALKLVALVDEGNFQPVLRRLARSEPGGVVTVALVRERNNARNPNAVCARTGNGENIGYLSEADARRYRPAIERLERRGITLRCPARLTVGTDADPSYVRADLELDPPEALR
jgi:hypothetical protein